MIIIIIIEIVFGLNVASVVKKLFQHAHFTSTLPFKLSLSLSLLSPSQQLLILHQ